MVVVPSGRSNASSGTAPPIVGNVTTGPRALSTVRITSFEIGSSIDVRSAISSDGLTWTIRIRPGIFFTDDPAFGGRKRELTAAALTGLGIVLVYSTSTPLAFSRGTGDGLSYVKHALVYAALGLPIKYRRDAVILRVINRHRQLLCDA